MNSNHLRIGFICEGPVDLEIVPVLVAKLLRYPVEGIPIRKETHGFDDFRRPKPGVRPGLNQAWGMFKSYVIALLIERADAIVVVVDNDRIEPPYTKRWWLLGRRLPFEGYPVRLVDASDVIAQCKQAHLELDDLEQYILKVRQEGIVPVIIGVAVQMLEAWLLAQPEVAENVLWEAITPARRALCMSPEQISHPKNEIIHPHNGGSDLTQTQARQIGGHPGFAPEPIEAACPSFARFAADIRILSTLP